MSAESRYRNNLGMEGTNASDWQSYSRNGYLACGYSRCTADWGFLGTLDPNGVPIDVTLMRSLLLPSYGSRNIIYIYQRPPQVSAENHGAWAAELAKRLCEQCDPGTIWAIEPTNEVTYAWYPPCTAANPGYPDYNMLAAWLTDIYRQVHAAVSPYGVKVIGPTIGTSKSVPESNAFIAAGGEQYLDMWAFHDYFDQAGALAVVTDKVEFYRSITSLPIINSECGVHEGVPLDEVYQYAAYHATEGIGLIGHQWTSNRDGHYQHGYWELGSERLVPTDKLNAILSGWNSVISYIASDGPNQSSTAYLAFDRN